MAEIQIWGCTKNIALMQRTQKFLHGLLERRIMS